LQFQGLFQQVLAQLLHLRHVGQAVFTHPGAAPRRHWVEGYVHWLQDGGLGRQEIEALATDIVAFGPGFPEQALPTAREIWAKRYLLRQARSLSLGWWDRAFLRLQLRRLERTGFAGGY
jgi:hypothetical protein